jgi:lipoprotein-releasing system permease protein
VRFILFIASRYLFSKKRIQVISLISWISVLGIFIGTAALVVLLSAFNGLEGWVIRLYNSFDSDIRIESAQGKWIDAAEFPLDSLRQIDGISHVAEVLEENCLVIYGDNQYVCTMKGVSDDYVAMTGVDTMMVDGAFKIKSKSGSMAVVGSGVAYSLSMSLNAIDKALVLYVPKTNIGSTLNPADAFRSEAIFPSGIFEIQPEFDARYIFTPIDFADKLTEGKNRRTAYEVQFSPSADKKAIEKALKAQLSEKYVVKNRFEQHELLYKVINAEKWAVFLVLCFILLIAVFNVTGSLTMLVVEKSADIRTLESMGADKSTIKGVFFAEGLMITVIGLITGLVCGLIIVTFQEMQGIVLINGEDPYPVLVKAKDILAICITVITIGAAASWFPASRAVNKRSLRSLAEI